MAGASVTTCKNSDVRVWDLATGDPFTPVLEHHDNNGSPRVWLSHDGLHLYTAAADMAVRSWDSYTGSLLREPDPLRAYVSTRVRAPSHSGKHLALIERSSVDIGSALDTQTFGRGRLIDTTPHSRASSGPKRDGWRRKSDCSLVAISRDGRVVQDVLVEDGEGRIVKRQRWDLSRQEHLREVTLETPLLQEPAMPKFWPANSLILWARG